MRQGTPWIVLLLVAATGVGLWFALRREEPPPPQQPTFEQLSDYKAKDQEGLRNLRSLPYLKWTERKADMSKKGVVVHDRERALPGYNLYTDYEDTVLLVDMDGEIVHTWRVSGYSKCAYATLLPDGHILAVCVGDPSPEPPGWKEGGLVRLDRASRKVWEYEQITHHDVCVLESGNPVVIIKTLVVPYCGRNVTFDELHFLTPDGKLSDRWSTHEHLAELQSCHEKTPLDSEPATPDEAVFDYHHLNSVQPLPDTPLGRADKRFQRGNYLICLRNVNVIAILDRDTKKLTWHWGADTLDFPHMPRMLASGNILVFDNGTHRGRSRVLEINPASGEVVWRYQTEPQGKFFSKFRGSNQRLANGNTLICESDKGRAFEVTAGGEIVWDFWNPIFDKSGKRRAMYRIERLAPEVVEPFLRRRD